LGVSRHALVDALFREPPRVNDRGGVLLATDTIVLLQASDATSAPRSTTAYGGWYVGEALETAAARFCMSVLMVEGVDFHVVTCERDSVARFVQQANARLVEQALWSSVPSRSEAPRPPLLQLPPWVMDVNIMSAFTRRRAPSEWQRTEVAQVRAAKRCAARDVRVPTLRLSAGGIPRCRRGARSAGWALYGIAGYL
jgi:hypothetical protein